MAQMVDRRKNKKPQIANATLRHNGYGSIMSRLCRVC